MTFPIQPFLDRVIIRVTPLEELFTQGKVEIPLDSSHVKVRSDRGIVMAIGEQAAPVCVGDEVRFDDLAYGGKIYLQPHDAYRRDLPIYLEVRVGDLLGRSIPVENSVEVVENSNASLFA